jgi:modulator of FtsH protease HflK
MSDLNHSDSPEPRRPQGQGPPVQEVDPAASSLAEALRVSFRLLTVIMVGMVFLFLSTGLKAIKPNEAGVVKVFGRYVRTARPGLTYNWPFPVGKIEIVQTDEKSLTLEDFWMHETARDKTIQDLSKRSSASAGLRPGWDGALLTGDRYLLHQKIDCTYHVSDPKAFRQFVGDAYIVRWPGSIQGQRIDPAEDAVRSVLCSEAIRSVATKTADDLMRSGRDRFAADVMRSANVRLAEMETGLEVRQVRLPSATWPLQARGAYEAAQQASKRAEERRSRARSTAEGILRATAGEQYVDLVGHPWGTREALDATERTASYDLIGDYARARDENDAERAEEILRRIDEVLLASSGDVQTIISEARAYETDVTQRVLARVVQFEQLLPKYRQAPKFFMERLWAAARDEILNAPGNEKYYIAQGDGKTVLRISRDPDIDRKIRLEKMRANQQGR